EIFTQLERIGSERQLVDDEGKESDVERPGISGQRNVWLLSEQVHIRKPFNRRQARRGFANQDKRPLGSGHGKKADETEVNQIGNQAEKTDDGFFKRANVVGNNS